MLQCVEFKCGLSILRWACSRTEPFSRFFHAQSFPHPPPPETGLAPKPLLFLGAPAKSNPEPLGPHCTVAPNITLTAALLQGCAEGSAHLALLPRQGQEVWEPDAQSIRLLPADLPERSVSTRMPLGQHPTSLAHRIQGIPESDTGDSRELK